MRIHGKAPHRWPTATRENVVQHGSARAHTDAIRKNTAGTPHTPAKVAGSNPAVLANTHKETLVIRTGFVDWKRLLNSGDWQYGTDGTTHVHAFWPADPGLTILDRHHTHGPADILTARIRPHVLVSDTFTDVFDQHLDTIPLLASIRAGTLSGLLRHQHTGTLFAADNNALTRAGRRAVAKLCDLYERRPVWVTFADRPSDEDTQTRPRS